MAPPDPLAARISSRRALTTAGVSMCADWVTGLWLGAAVILGGALTTWLLHLAGWGKPSGPRPADQWDWRTRDASHHPGCLGATWRRAPRPLADRAA
ncbi:hypothetical protein KCMC57_up50720 [Kitasatospora sp. CMC57]|uniref:Uncharacterized protein n=1 Tax=Kitasatospora sp. CMC57 TaxID=3231513 RepID=A0AB33K1I6_9ACTN